MRIKNLGKRWGKLVCCGLMMSFLPGCITFSNYGIPADRIPEGLKAAEKGKRLPLNFALLGQPAPRDYTLAPGDVLGVYVKGLIPVGTDEATPLLQGQANFTNVYYPPTGQSATPAVGLPMEINTAGVLQFPQIGEIDVNGLTIDQAAKKIATACVKKEIIKEGKEYVYLTLVRSRVVRVMVVRDEAPENPTFLAKQAPLLSKRGHAQVVDLPAFENDVLHALTISGGLPGYDAFNEVWVLRRSNSQMDLNQQVWSSPIVDGQLPGPLHACEENATATKIPLWVNACDAPCFTQQDVTLHEGDIVYVRSRSEDFFYTGGLLPGGIVPMPRDHDIDIVEAISLANGSVGGAGGASGIQVIRTGSGPGNIIPPTRATIVRKLPNKQQIAIRVDLNKSLRDPKHRPIVQPGDLISLHYKPGEVFSNSALNMINLNYVIPGGD